MKRPGSTYPTTRTLGDYTRIEEIQEANRRFGQHWFSADTMRFFGSRVGYQVYGGCYFVSSENYFDIGRRYSVRVAYSDGFVDTVGEYQQYVTRAQAVAEAVRLAAKREAS